MSASIVIITPTSLKKNRNYGSLSDDHVLFRDGVMAQIGFIAERTGYGFTQNVNGEQIEYLTLIYHGITLYVPKDCMYLPVKKRPTKDAAITFWENTYIIDSRDETPKVYELVRIKVGSAVSQTKTTYSFRVAAPVSQKDSREYTHIEEADLFSAIEDGVITCYK